MTTDERTETNIESFIAPAAETGSITLRPFSAGTLTICRALGLSMVVGGDKEQVEALSADDKQRQLTTFLFIQSQPLDVVKKAVKLSRENRQAFEDEYLLPFELELPVTAMFTAMQQLEQNLTAIEAAQIEVITRPSGSKKEPTPPPN
jgi:precorrin-4 methylase